MDPVTSGPARAAVVLAWSLARVLLARAFSAPTGLGLFRRNYGPDRLPPFTDEQRDVLMQAGRCIACGRCDVGEAERMLASRGAYRGIQSLVLSSTRQTPDFDAALAALAHVPDEVLREKEPTCPVDVPFERLARVVREQDAAAREMPALALLAERALARR
jgi:hypothetical protein